MKAEAERLGLVTKRRTDAAGPTNGERGRSRRGHLHQLLSNPSTPARSFIRGTSTLDDIPPIIDPETFDERSASLRR